jgi:hypothetical protein
MLIKDVDSWKTHTLQMIDNWQMFTKIINFLKKGLIWQPNLNTPKFWQ